MTDAPPLRATLKRGALVAAANWPLIVVQFVAESTLKLLLAVPVVGGIVLVVLLLEGNADELLAGDVRQIVTAVFGALRQNPAALIAFTISFGIVVLGGSVLTFVIKGGTVALLARAEALAGPIERPPLRLNAIRRAGVVTIDGYLDGCSAALAPVRPSRHLPVGRIRVDRVRVPGPDGERVPRRRQHRPAPQLDCRRRARVERAHRLDFAGEPLLPAHTDGDGRGRRRRQDGGGARARVRAEEPAGDCGGVWRRARARRHRNGRIDSRDGRPWPHRDRSLRWPRDGAAAGRGLAPAGIRVPVSSR